MSAFTHRVSPGGSTLPAALPTRDRLVGLDAARVLATVGVVWFHTIEADLFHRSGVLGRFSVAFYTMAAMVFLVDSAVRRPRPAITYISDRFRRLVLPFFGWSAITLIALAVNDSFDGAEVRMPAFSWNMLVDGGTIHLWYIPFLFVASAAAWPVVLWMSAKSWRKGTVASVCVLCAVLLDAGFPRSIPLQGWPVIGHFFEITSERWSGVYWGIAVAIFWQSALATSRWRKPLALAGLAILFATCLWQWNHGIVAQLKVYGGLGLLLAALAPWDNPVVRLLAPFGRMSAGVYFAHMAAIYLMRALVAANGAAEGDWARDVFVFIGAILIAFSGIALLSRIPGLQWLAGYEGKPSPLFQRAEFRPAAAAGHE